MGLDDDVATRTVARAAAATKQTRATFALRVTEGPDTGSRFEVEAAHPSPILVGKSETCDIRLNDPSVSRRHLSLQVVDARLNIRDLDSTNGTVVDGVMLTAGFLRGGELIRIGNTAFVTERGEAVSEALTADDRFGSVIGASSAMRKLYPFCQRLAASNLPLLIEGETGTGKEQLAESLHAAGPRADHAFVVFDCTAVAPNLIASELFGHVRGAFTGAVSDHCGVFERAHGGTLLIDEIGDLPLDLQPKLLRAIERQQVTRVGGDFPISVDVRLLAATRRNLDREIQLGRFRDDLFYRTAVARIELPPLRARTGDVTVLARHFWQALGGQASAFPHEALRRWENDDWAGNVRELRNAVQRVFALGDFDVQFRPSSAEAPSTTTRRATSEQGDWLGVLLTEDLPFTELRQRALSLIEARYARRLLESHRGDTARAAATAGMSRRSFQRLLARNK